ncbi:MAG: hypothetical protein QM770_08110 [Tepidisphaeraceae bacterium]
MTLLRGNVDTTSSITLEGADIERLTLKTSTGDAIRIDESAMTLLPTPDGMGVIAAGRSIGTDGRAIVGRWNFGGAPGSEFTLSVDSQFPIRPAGLATDLTARRIAVLFGETAAEGVLQIYDAQAGPNDAPREILLASLGDVKPAGWDSKYSPVTWLDAKTLLLYGNTVIDAETGGLLGRLSIDGVVGVLPSVGNVVPMVTSDGMGRKLVYAIVDAEALDATRKR